MSVRLARQVVTDVFQLKVDDCDKVCGVWSYGIGVGRHRCLSCCPCYVKAGIVGEDLLVPVVCLPVEEAVALVLMED